MRALRRALSLTQGRLAEVCGFRSYRYVLLIESGRNKLSLANVQAGLAQGFRLSIEQLRAYLAGDLPLETAVAVSRSTSEAAPATFDLPRRTSAA